LIYIKDDDDDDDEIILLITSCNDRRRLYENTQDESEITRWTQVKVLRTDKAYTTYNTEGWTRVGSTLGSGRVEMSDMHYYRPYSSRDALAPVRRQSRSFGTSEFGNASRRSV